MLLYATGIDPYFEEMVQNAERAWYLTKHRGKSPELFPGPIPRRRGCWRPSHEMTPERGGRLESSAIDPRVIELEAAKEILAEIFRIRA